MSADDKTDMMDESGVLHRRKPLPQWTVPVVASLVLLVSGAVFAALWWWVGKAGLAGKDLATAQLDVVKVVSGVAVGGGGLFALYLAARRQHTQELEGSLPRARPVAA
ncbi:hypothetical protein [Lentzea sp. NPDC060358]|uniref:hypothetical protein n=1 Tax=Lentzea sp. NPDC060358 TaxID=3347103 RepID=UPI003651ACB2